MADRFSCYKDLVNEMEEGKDFQIVHSFPYGSIAAVVAPHGGKIEKYTSELACIIAGHSFAYYSFEGMLPNNNRDLHITSHNFDEPIALDLVTNVDLVLGIHGMRDRTDGIKVCLGGLDLQLVDHLAEQLTKIDVKNRKTGHDFPAVHPNNICNRGRLGAGAQLELSLSFRNTLFDQGNSAFRLVFAESVRKAMNLRIGG